MGGVLGVVLESWVALLPVSQQLRHAGRPQTPRVPFAIAVYAHRGGPLESARLIENTMAAFRHSAKLKVDLLETDVQLTKDGKVVLFHDRDMSRLCGQQYKGLRIADFNFQELPHLLPKLGHHGAVDTNGFAASGLHTPVTDNSRHEAALRHAPAAAAALDPAAGPARDDAAVAAAGATVFAGARIPLLEDLFNEFPTFPVQVDIKVRTPGLVEATLEIIRRQPGRDGLVLLGSFIQDVNDGIYQAAPDIPLFACAPRILYLLTAYTLGTLSLTHIYESAIVLPWRLPVIPSWGIYKSLLIPGFFSALNQRGVAVIVYGASDFNREEIYRQIKVSGANAVCADKPSMLQSLLEREGPLAPLPWRSQGSKAAKEAVELA